MAAATSLVQRGRLLLLSCNASSSSSPSSPPPPSLRALECTDYTNIDAILK
uniref:Uncharacterized protein n=1 Tax=Oryza australiensis TaxID=4532 RepID=A0A1V1H236_9ORYZ|nr:hypothetical protein [Oryza australiensis]